MFYPGLVSISFRNSSPEEIVKAAKSCGLTHIEWGSDVHAPRQDAVKLEQIKQLHQQYGISCCSYGTYFRLGYTPVEELPMYIKAAKQLGTNILRLWAGRKKAQDCTAQERDYLFEQCRKAAELAEKHDVILCLECHRRSYTETKEGALELMQAVHSPNFQMYWQPNPDISVSDNLQYISLLNAYITHIHVFNWFADQRFPLSDGMDDWLSYLNALSGSHNLLLEFVPDDTIQSLPGEAHALIALIRKHSAKT